MYHVFMILYHAGPNGLTELLSLRELIDSGVTTIEAAQLAWKRKWGDYIEDYEMDEISFTTDKAEAEEIAKSINGTVYEIDAEPYRINEEGYPVLRGPVSL